jgi:hypothetical protein
MVNSFTIDAHNFVRDRYRFDRLWGLADMTSYIGGLIVIGLAVAMIVYGRARNGIPRPFLQSYPVGIAYIMTAMALLVFGVALIVVGAAG